MRIYDTRLGRFLSIDPLIKKYPELTPYQFASNSPVSNIDIDGKEAGGAEEDLEPVKLPEDQEVDDNLQFKDPQAPKSAPQGRVATSTGLGGILRSYYEETFNSPEAFDHVGEVLGAPKPNMFNLPSESSHLNNSIEDELSKSSNPADREMAANIRGAKLKTTNSDETQNRSDRQVETLKTNRANSVKSERLVRSKLESELGSDEAILAKPRIYINGEKGKYAVPDFAIYNTKTGQITRVVDAKNGNAQPTPAQEQLNTNGGTFKGSSRATATPQAIPKGKLEVERTNVTSN